MDIVKLVAELERQKTTRKDYVAAQKDIWAENAGGEIKIGVLDKGLWPMNRVGTVQLANKLGIPIKYYEAMLKEGMVDLTAENVNRWLEKHQLDRRLIRTLDGQIRAVLSDRYRPMDNFDLAMMTMDRAHEHGANVLDAQLTESRMYVKLTVPDYKEQLKAGDEVVPGLLLSNSEVGEGAFRVEPFLWRLVCSNGLVGTSNLYKVHIGAKLALGELIFKDDTIEAMDQGIWKQARDIIDATFDGKILKRLVAQLKTAQDMPIEKPTEAVNVTVKDLGLSDERKLNLIRYFAREGDTLFGLVNGITRLAQDYKDYDERVGIERYAGEVLEARIPTVTPRVVA